MKKQFLRVKQMADQTFLRAEKSEVLTEDLIIAEKRVDLIKQSIQTSLKKIASCQIDFSSELSQEKCLKKMPQTALAATLLENGNTLSKESILGVTLRDSAAVQAKLCNELFEFYCEVEKTVLKPIGSILENEVHSINKLRKQLGKLTLDMDSARNRFLAAERHSFQVSSTVTVNSASAKVDKIDTLKDELEEASQKVEQCRDTLAAEMFSLISKEPYLAKLFMHFHQLQMNYHKNALAALESSLPDLEKQLSNFSQKPVYGCSLAEHLRVTNREIALVVDACISFLLEYGILEEGLLRIAGSASKVKKLKNAFDAGIDLDMMEYIRDPHAVSGALKSYLRELPEPLLTFELYEEWMEAAKIQEFEARVQTLWLVLQKLPVENFINLRCVIKFLSKLHDNADINKMSSYNIAIVMAPNLIWSPNEDVSFGMNMSEASAHSTIVEMLILYADWFFSDAASPPSPITEISCGKLLNNNIVISDIPITEQLSIGQNFPSESSSPRTPHKTNKKPVAPPPPSRKLSDYDKQDSVIISESLNLSENVSLLSDLNFHSQETSYVVQSSVQPPVIPSPRLSVIRRRSNENISSTGSTKGEKPVIPERPPSYSTYSLDRKLHRTVTKSTGSEKIEHVVKAQRPTVPPPERPSKPSRFSTIENSNSIGHQKIVLRGDTCEIDPFISHDIKSGHDPYAAEICDITNSELSTADSVKQLNQISRTSSKQNRFDFLVSQTAEKPPERPPRSMSAVYDSNMRTSQSVEDVNIPIVECCEQLSGLSVNYTSREPNNMSSTLSVLAEADKVKPPRPQPPVPSAKPKINSEETTNL